MFREPSVDQEREKKDAPEPQRHSTGKQRSSLSLMQIHTPIQKFLAFLKRRCALSVCLCLPCSSFSVHLRQTDVFELVEVERRFCLTVSTFFFFLGESRHASVCREVHVIQ